MSVQNKLRAEIIETLAGSIQKNAIDFLTFLEENEMIVGGHHGEISYKNNTMCFISLGNGSKFPDPWTIYIEGEYTNIYGDISISERLKEIAWTNIHTCGSCSDCRPGKTVVMFGKSFENVCCNAELAFYMPNKEALECVEKILEMRKCEILKNVK